MSAALSTQVLEKKPKDELRCLYNSLHGVVPGVVPINDNDRVSKAELVERIMGLKNIRPRHLSLVHNKSAFAIRDYLRRAARREGLDHMLNKPWRLSGLEYVILCGKILNAELKEKSANDNTREEEPAQEGVPQEAVSEEVTSEDQPPPAPAEEVKEDQREEEVVTA